MPPHAVTAVSAVAGAVPFAALGVVWYVRDHIVVTQATVSFATVVLSAINPLVKMAVAAVNLIAMSTHGAVLDLATDLSPILTRLELSSAPP